MAKGVLGNDPFRRGAAPRTEAQAEPEKKVAKEETPAARSRARAKKRMDEQLAGAPAGTELKDPRNRKPKKSRPTRPPRAFEAPAEPPDPTLERTAEIQAAAPDPQVKETPLPRDRSPKERLDMARKVRASHQQSPSEVVQPAPAPEPPDLTEAPPSDPDAFRAQAKDAARTAAREAFQRASGALTLAREVAAQTLRTDSVGGAARVARGVVSAVLTGLGVSGSDEVDSYGKDERLTRQLSPLSDFFYDRYWRVTVEGASHLPRGPSILVANHSGAIPVDGLVLHQALQRERPDLLEARWLAEDQIFHAPFLGTLFNRLGAIRASPENAVRLLQEGRPVITFPEGVHGIRKPFQERYQLKRLGRGGFAKLAVRHQVPIVPVAVVGAEESLPLLGKLPGGFLGLPYLPVTVPPLPARWQIRFGEPLAVDEISPEAADDLVEIQRLVERTRDAIEGMLRALLSDRTSVF